MAKRQRGMTKSKIEKWLKEGRGQGLDTDYKPWLTVQDVPSAGRTHREIGMKVPRQYTFFSDLENRYFNIIEYSFSVVDIREQFPLLPLEETILIASELGIKHPTDPYSGEDIVMTTDFLITVTENGRNKLLARTVKMSSDLNSERVIEKFEIERRFWNKQGIDWGIVTEQDINRVFADNIKVVRKYYDLKICGLVDDLTVAHREQYLAQLANELSGDAVSVRNICHEFDEKNGLNQGTSLAFFKHLVVTRKIDLDIVNQPIELTKPIQIKLPDYGYLESGVEAI